MRLFKILFFTVLCAGLAITGVIYYRYYFVFGKGIKSGELNQIVLKGTLFKTYEGRLIQAGFKGSQTNTIQSYEFTFSVEDEYVAKRLERLGGKSLELHYVEYKNTLPWRGNSVYVVDSIVSIAGTETYETTERRSAKKRARIADEEEADEVYDEVFNSSEYYERR